MPTRKVLTVNQVFEIMIKWVETRDWEKALYDVMPKRKFQGKLGHEEAEEDGGNNGSAGDGVGMENTNEQIDKSLK
jgi:tRNA (guanine9-N1)-methyltransferase